MIGYRRTPVLIAFIVFTCLFAIFADAQNTPPPEKGFIPDEATAVRVAEAVLGPIYGEKHVRSERPFKARLDGDYWIVEGSLPKPRRHNEMIVGGTAMVEINRKSGCIRAAYHLK